MSALPRRLPPPNRIPISVDLDLSRKPRLNKKTYTVRFRATEDVQEAEEKIRTHLPPGCSLADFQREVYTSVVREYQKYLVATKEIRFGSFSIDQIEQMKEEDEKWEKFRSQLPELAMKVTQQYEQGEVERAEEKLKIAIGVIGNYSSGPSAIRVLKALQAGVPDELKRVFPRLPVSFGGLEDFTPADPDSEPEL